MSAVTSSSVLPSNKKPGARNSPRRLSIGRFATAIALFLIAALAHAQSNKSILPGPKPTDAAKEWKELVGIYSDDQDKKRTFVLLEQNGKLLWRDEKGVNQEFRILGNDTVFIPSEGNSLIGHSISRDDSGHVNGFCYLNFCYERKDSGTLSSQSSHITPVRSPDQLRRTAVAATPPQERGPFRQPDLVELTSLDPAIHLDIRYATSNDFLGVPVYTQARAFLQHPAAEALLRVLRKLQPLGYGLLVHDGYRPWYVTKIFWDATPPEGKIFVADPKQGSRHNRGCAVDLTLYDLKTSQPVEMTGAYDEMSPRSFPNYPGGTSLQRWHRDLLRRAMESEGFTVYESE